MNKLHKELLVKFTLSFTIIMVVPLAFVSFFLLSSINKNQIEKITMSSKSEMNGIADSFQGMVQNANNVQMVLSKKPFFYDFFIRENGGAFVYISDTLNESVLQSSSFGNILFHSSTTDMIYGGESYSTKAYLSFLDSSATDSFSATLGTNTPIWTDPYTINNFGIKSDVISYVLPFELEDNTQRVISNLIFNFDISKITDLLKSTAYFQDSFFFIYDDSNLVFSSDPSLDHLSTSLLDNEETMYTINNNEYLLIPSYKSGNIQVLCLTDFNVINDYANKSFGIYIIYCLLSLVLGASLIVFFVKYNYTPIQKLNKSILELGIDINVSGDYFNNLSTSLIDLSTTNTQLAKDHISMEQESFLSKLLRTPLSQANRDDIYKICNLTNINIDRPYLLCVAINFKDLPAKNIFKSIAHHEEYDFYECRSNYNNTISFLLALDSNHYEVVYEFLDEIKAQCPIDTTGIGISSPKKDFTNISSAYQEAIISCNHSLEHGEPYVKYIDIVGKHSVDIYSIINESEQLKEAISNEDFDKILLCYNEMLINLNNINDIALLKMFCFEIVVKCLNAYEKLQWSEYHSPHNAVYKLYNIETTENPLQILSDVIKEIAYAISNHTILIPKKLNIDDVLYDVNTQYLEDDFSIKSLSSSYQVSISNLSHFFKKSTGQTLSDYITTLKMDTVKKMLVDTDFSIQYISEYVGYMHTSNFIKKFKLIEEVTPQQYRKKFKS